MTRKNLVILVVAVLAIFGAASLFDGRDSVPALAGEPLLPRLDARLAEVSAVELRGADDEKVTLRHTGQGWVVGERGDYPARGEQVNALLLGLAQARSLEAKTARPEQHHRLGLQDVGEPGAPGTLVRLLNREGDSLVDLIVGDAVPGLGRYARRADEAQSWLVDGLPQLERQPAHWLEDDLIDLAPERVHRIDVEPAEGEAFSLVRERPDEGFVLEDSPEQRLEPTAVNRLTGALSGLKLDDVAAAGEGAAPRGAIRYSTFDGWHVRLQWLEEEEDRLLASWRLDHDPELAARFSDSSRGPGWSEEEGGRIARRLNDRVMRLSPARSERLQPMREALTGADS